MSALSAMMRSALVIGLMMGLISQLYPGANASWYSFQTTLETGLQMPTFENPSGIGGVSNRTLVFSDPGAYAPTGTQDCSSTRWNECLNTDPTAGNVTFRTNFTVYIAPFGITGGTMKALHFRWYCSLQDWDGVHLYEKLYVNITRPDGTMISSVSVPASCFYHTLSYAAVASATSTYSTDFLNGAILEVDTYKNADGSDFNASMSQMIVQVDYQGGASVCSSWDIACAFSSAANLVIQPIVNALQLMWNAITYVFRVIWAVLSFTSSLFVGLFAGFFGSFAYFFALPGCPPFVQAIIDAIMIAELVMIFLIIGSYVVGIMGGMANKL